MSPEPDRRIQVRYLDLSAETVTAALVAEGLSGSLDAQKDRALALLGIARQEGEGHLQAWCRAMAEENGLPVRQPVVPELRDAMLDLVSRLIPPHAAPTGNHAGAPTQAGPGLPAISPGINTAEELSR